MTSVADAYVDLHVNGDHLDGEVRSSVRDSGRAADKEADKSGQRIGSRMASGFLKRFEAIHPGVIQINTRVTRTFRTVSRGFTANVVPGIARAVAKASNLVDGLGGRVRALGTRFRDVGRDIARGFSGLRSLAIPALVSLVPLLTSAISALGGSLVAFTGAVSQAASSSLALGGVFGSLIQGLVVAKVAFKGFGKALKGDAEALAALSPNARAAAEAMTGLGKAGGALKRAIQQSVFAGLSGSIARLGTTLLPGLRGSLTQTGTVLNGFFREMLGFAASEGFVKRLNAVLTGNNVILGTLLSSVRPLVSGLLSLFTGLTPSAIRLSEVIKGAADRFAEWAKNAAMSGGIDRFMQRAAASASSLWAILRNLGGVLRNVFGAATGPGDGLLKTLAGLTGRLREFTDLASTRSAIAEWAQQGIEVTGTLFRGLGAGFKAISGLFDPAILGGFFDVFKAAMPTIKAVVGTIQGALAPVLSAIGEGLAKNGPAIAGLFTALGPLLKGVGAVIGNVITQALGIVGLVARVVTPVVGAISNLVGPVLQKFAPIIASVILGFTTWGATLVKFIPVVGRLLAPVVQFASFLLRGIVPALRVVGTVFGTVFRLIGTVVGVHLRVVRAVVTAVFGFVRGYVSGSMGAVRSVVGGAIGAVRGAFSAGMGAVRSATSAAFGAVRSIVGRVMGGLRGTVSGGITGVVNIIRGLPGRIASLAGRFGEVGRSLGRSVITGLGNGLRAAGGFISDIAGSVRSAVNSGLGLPRTIKGPGPLPDLTIPAFAHGTVAAPGGMALVGERGPEVVNLPRGSKVHTANASRGMQAAPAAALPDRVVLRIGEREFVAWVESIADDRIEADASLHWQGD